jgi:hypothetical protein
MTKLVSYVSDEAIEKDAQSLLAEYAHARSVVIEPPIAIDDIIEKYLTDVFDKAFPNRHGGEFFLKPMLRGFRPDG